MNFRISFNTVFFPLLGLCIIALAIYANLGRKDNSQEAGYRYPDTTSDIIPNTGNSDVDITFMSHEKTKKDLPAIQDKTPNHTQQRDTHRARSYDRYTTNIMDSSYRTGQSSAAFSDDEHNTSRYDQAGYDDRTNSSGTLEESASSREIDRTADTSLQYSISTRSFKMDNNPVYSESNRNTGSSGVNESGDRQSDNKSTDESSMTEDKPQFRCPLVLYPSISEQARLHWASMGCSIDSTFP